MNGCSGCFCKEVCFVRILNKFTEDCTCELAARLPYVSALLCLLAAAENVDVLHTHSHLSECGFHSMQVYPGDRRSFQCPIIQAESWEKFMDE